jgi:predicted RNA binding protein YcfA (HicA-like mRNA interferase family)
MPKLRILSGKEVVNILNKFGFIVVSQKGSHIKMVRKILNHNQMLLIPNHKELDRGMLKGIINQSTKFIKGSELEKEFYTN